MYHRLGAPSRRPGGELVPVLGADLFGQQLAMVAAEFDVVPPSQILDAAAARRPGQRFPVALTFDDDLGSHVEIACPVLRRAGLPAAFFVCGASLSSPHEFWWEHLQRVVDLGLRPAVLGPLRSAPISEMASWIEKLGPSQRQAVATGLADAVGGALPASGLRASAVRELAGSGFEVGFHTLRHDPLVGLDDDSLRQALTDGRDELGEMAGRLTMIAYPHGRADARVASAARGLGYRLGFTTSWDALRAEDDPLLLPRVEPSFESAAHLADRMARRLLAAARRPVRSGP